MSIRWNEIRLLNPPNNQLILLHDHDDSYFGYRQNNEFFVLVNQIELVRTNDKSIRGKPHIERHNVFDWVDLDTFSTNVVNWSRQNTTLRPFTAVIILLNGHVRRINAGFFNNFDSQWYRIAFNFNDNTGRDIPIGTEELDDWHLLPE